MTQGLGGQLLISRRVIHSRKYPGMVQLLGRLMLMQFTTMTSVEVWT